MLLDSNKKILILIPALNPTQDFIEYVELLIKSNFKNILVINDGSEEKCNSIFEKIELYSECNIITHLKNEGKGKSIKDGLSFFQKMNNVDEFIGIITVDCDGQHSIKDVINIANEMSKNNNALLLGMRTFDKSVPIKSSIGNKITSNIFKILYGEKISDTQTGLRGIPNSLIDNFINLVGNRYEYETNMLIECILKRIKILEIPIQTIYIDDNSNSHFRPIIDSACIYWKLLSSFIKYSIFSVMSCIIDIILFKIFLLTINLEVEKTVCIVIATIFARCISSFVNFILNKKVAFNSNEKISKSIIKYYALSITQMLISAILVSSIYKLTNISEVVIKLIVDTILFFINYRVQRIFIFNK